MIIERKDETIFARFSDIKAGWEQKFLFTSDVHFDSIYCDRKLLKEHFDEARDLGAYIVIVGDWFDAMQGKFDPRRDMGELRPEYFRADYYDFVVTDSVEWLKKYKENLMVIAYGNHETSVIDHVGTDLTERLVYALRMEGSPVVKGEFGGWIKLMFNAGNHKSTLNVHYFHGAGGANRRTKGMLSVDLQAKKFPDAHLIVNGHTHTEFTTSTKRDRITQDGRKYKDLQHFIKTPGYKGLGHWEEKKDMDPQANGSILVTVKCKSGKDVVITTTDRWLA